MSRNPSAAAWKRFIVFILGVPGYLAVFMPWLFTLALILYSSISYVQNDYVVFVVEDLQYEDFSVNWATVLASIAVSAGLWLFVSWLTKRLLLFIALMFGSSERTWQTVKVSALLGGWFMVMLLGFFVFDVVVPGFLVSLVFVSSLGLLSFGLEYLLGRAILPTKKA